MKICEICGIPLSSKKAKYCSECQKEKKSERARGGDAKRKWTKHVAKSQASLNKKIAEARKLGISYGQYVAREYAKNESCF